MAKYTFEFMKKVVFEYLYGKTSSTTLAKNTTLKVKSRFDSGFIIIKNSVMKG